MVVSAEGILNDIYSSKMPLISPKDQAVLTQSHTDLPAHDLGIAKWVADSNITVIGHESQEDASATPTQKTKYIWVMQAKETVWFFTVRWISMCGMVVVMKQTSRKDRWPEGRSTWGC